jgi:hypothetical protein
MIGWPVEKGIKGTCTQRGFPDAIAEEDWHQFDMAGLVGLRGIQRVICSKADGVSGRMKSL